MTQEDKELLFKDLCARLPYGVKYQTYLGDIFTLKDITLSKTATQYYIDDNAFSLSQIKPYLRPMSSMTEEEKNELRNILWFGYPSDDNDKYSHRGIEIKNCLYDDEDKSEYDFEEFELLKEFLLKNHFDYRGLIPMGLALKASEDMYK